MHRGFCHCKANCDFPDKKRRLKITLSFCRLRWSKKKKNSERVHLLPFNRIPLQYQVPSTLRRRNLKTGVSRWKASNVFRPHYAGGIWKRNNHRSFSGSKSVFERLRFRDGLVWTEGQTPHIKLRFQIPTASCWRGLRLSAGKSLVVGNFLPSHAITQSRDARYKDFRIKVGKDFVTIHWKVTFFDSFSFRNYSLCEITVEDGGLIKQRRLPDMLTNLPDRIHLNGRSVNSPNSDPK